MNFKTIIKLCEKHGFLQRINAFQSCSNLERAFAIGPIGSLLFENLKNEWLQGIVNNKEHSVFWSLNSFSDSYNFAREMCLERVPFGIAETLQIRNPKIDGSQIADDLEKSETDVPDFSICFKDFNYLRCTMFIAPDDATLFFHKWQRQRRMWWRKFSPTPGRYYTTDIENGNNGTQSVEIRAKYPWGTQLVETLQVTAEKHSLLTQDQLMNKVSKKQEQSHYLTSTVSIPTMYLNSICDSYEELKISNEARTFFRFHRKLAPYKISFAVPLGLSGTTGDDLSDLALYLCKKLRAHNIVSLLLPSSTRSTLEQQFSLYDQIGVPYTAVLNENTLKNGIIQLRSRDTTLKEQIHISELPNYVETLFKNY